MLATMMRVPIRIASALWSAAAGLGPMQLQGRRLQFPVHAEPADIDDRAPYFAALVASSCSASVSVWAETGWKRYFGPTGLIFSPGRRDRGQLLVDQRREIGACQRECDSRVSPATSRDPAFDGRDISGMLSARVAARSTGRSPARSWRDVHLAGEQRLADLGLTPAGDSTVTPLTRNDAARRIMVGAAVPSTAGFAVRAAQAEFGLMGPALDKELVYGLLQARPSSG